MGKEEDAYPGSRFYMNDRVIDQRKRHVYHVSHALLSTYVFENDGRVDRG